MSTENFKRKLTAILSADVAGYSRLMGDDEEATVLTLNKFKEMIFGLVERHNGRLVDSPGDNLLAEFTSVVDAVRCGVQVQEDLKVSNEDLPTNRKMMFRIGINTGDVIQDGDRIYGDGVNVAARIESLADPGGICISRTAYDQVKKKLNIEYEYQGEYEVKNIDEPVRVYRVKMVSKVETPSAPVVKNVEEALKTIAVLPLADLSPGKDQEYFADGIAEELLNSLSRISELEVRGRTSSFYFKGKNEDLRTISKMLNVDHILEGSVRKAGEQVRITVQLINTPKDTHIWSKTYDRTMDDIFAIQEDIARSVADALQITLGVGELGREPGMTSNINAYDAYLDGHSLKFQVGREAYSQAIEQLEKAVALDPDFAICWYELAYSYLVTADLIPERDKEFSEKARLAFSRVVELIPESDLALRIAASRSGDWVEFERLYKKALTLNPAKYDTNSHYAWFLNNVGRPREAIEYYLRCMRMEPLSSFLHFYIGNSYYLSGNSDAATMFMKKARELTKEPTMPNLGLMVLALEENNRALIDEYAPLIVNAKRIGSVNKANTRDLDQVMHALLDTPEDAVAELRLFLTDPNYNNTMNLSGIAIWASYFEDHELALQVFNRESIKSDMNHIFAVWRPIHKRMRRLAGFKELVRETGLVDYWRTSGNWGDFCRPVGDGDFVCD